MVAIAAVAWVFLYVSLPDRNLRVYALDVGQGDAIFIETPNKSQILIDGGPDSKVLSELSAVMPFYDRNIDLLVLTHPQMDHIFGLVEVLKRYSVAAVLMTGVEYQSGAYDEFKRLISDKHIPVYAAHAGQKILFGDGAGLDVVYPLAPMSGKPTTDADVNDTSVGVKLTFGKEKFLFMGDATLGEEVELINSGQNIDIDVLKLSHHGSKTSSSQLFLEKTSPALVFASLGRNNRYGHPHKEVLDRIGDIPFYRTDLHGRVEIVSNGKKIWAHTER